MLKVESFKVEHINAFRGDSSNSKYKKLAYIKKLKLEAYGYLVEAVRLLEEQFFRYSEGDIPYLFLNCR